MAYKTFDPSENGYLESNQVGNSGHDIKLSYNGEDSLALPDDSFVRDADISRDGMNLVLETDQGTVTVENYFADSTPPNLTAPNGLTLTPELVDAFVQSEAKFADAGTSMNDASPIGAIQEISGEVTITRGDGTFVSGSIGTPIYQGDIVETNAEGAVNIMFVDETTFAVSEDARLAIDEYVFDPATQSGTSNFSVLKGVFVFTSGLIGRDDPDDVEIDTPSGSIGIRGTIIAGNVDTGEITVIEGAIVLHDFSGNSVTLANQYETARFMPDSNSIEYMGELAANDVAAKFTSVSNVSGTLFSSIQDSATDNQGDTQTNTNQPAETQSGDSTTEGNTPSGESNGAQNLAPAPAPAEIITSTDIVKAGTPVQDAKPFQGGTATTTTNTQAEPLPAPVSSAPPPPPPTTSEPAAVFSVTVQRIDVQENNTNVVEVAIIRGHFTSGMTLQLNGLSNTYFEAVQVNPTTFSIRTKAGVSLDSDTMSMLNFTAANDTGVSVISRVVDLNVLDEFEPAQFVSNAANTVGGANAFAASDNTIWQYDFADEFDDPDGQIASYSFSGTISGAPIDSINNAAFTSTGNMIIDFGDVDGSNYTLVVNALDSAGNVIASTSTYTFDTIDTNSVSTTLFANNEVVSLGGGNDTVTILSDGNSVFTEGGTDTISNLTGNNNYVSTGIGNDTITFNSGTGNSVFANAGNDTIVISGTSGQAALNGGGNNLYFDGGDGVDTLSFDSSGNIDFTAINNAYLHNLEVISTVNGSGTDTVRLSRSDVLAMTDDNHTVTIQMDVGDTFDFVNDGGTSFTYQGQAQGGLYDVYSDSSVTLLVSTNATMAVGSDLP